jgi:hypothetical protein
MKTILNFILMAVTAQAAFAGDLFFKTEDKSKEIKIWENFVHWIGRTHEGVEIGTASGVFVIKGGNTGCPLWQFVDKFKLNSDDVLFMAINMTVKSKNDYSPKAAQESYNELRKLAETPSGLTEDGNKSLAKMLISGGVAYDGLYYCTSIEFNSHDH